MLLYELLTGTTPFERKRLERGRVRRDAADHPRGGAAEAEQRGSRRRRRCRAIAAHRRTEPAKLGRLVRGDLDWIVMKALEKDRDRRYETANGLAMDVQRYLADEPVQACPPSVRYRLRKFVRRNKGPVLAASLVVLALVGGIIGTTWGMIRATDARAVAVNEAKQKEAALAAARQSERDATDQLFLALLNRARAGRFSRQMGQRLDSLAALARAARIRPDERLRDEAIAAMALPDVRRVPVWHSSPPGTAAVAYGGAVPALCPRRRPGDHQHPQPPRRPGDPAHRLGPASWRRTCSSAPTTGSCSASADGHTLRVWRVADGQPALRDELRGCRAHAFSPDGRHAGGRPAGVGPLLRPGDGSGSAALAPARAGPRAGVSPGQRPTGRRVLRSSVASVYDAASGALLADLPVGAMREPGRRLASGRGAPGRRGLRPAHPDLERGREAPSGDPGGPRAGRHGR